MTDCRRHGSSTGPLEPAPAVQSGLRTIDEVLSQLLREIAELAAVGTQEAPLERASGRVLAQAQYAAVDVPGYDNSAMDGYAARSTELGSQQLFTVSQRIPAGQSPGPLQQGTVARIFTGAPLPAGADAVVMQENCDTGEDPETVRILQPAAPGENVRRAGSDLNRGDRLLPAGHRLRPQDIGLLASTGIAKVTLRRPLRVALLSTGDELVAPGEALQPGQIYNSNYFMLAALLEDMGHEVIHCGSVIDTADATAESLAEAADRADCIVSSGGVSAGEEDHIRAAIQRVGSLSLWKLAIKPGKPFAFGHIGKTPVFGLPGNPVSAFVTFLLLVRPCLRAMLGMPRSGAGGLSLPAGFELPRSGSRQEYLRVSVSEEGELVPFRSQSSGVLSSLCYADGLAIVPAGSVVARGDLLRFLPFSEILT